MHRPAGRACEARVLAREDERSAQGARDRRGRSLAQQQQQQQLPVAPPAVHSTAARACNSRAVAREDEWRRRAVSFDDEHAPHGQRDSNSNSNVPCWREAGPPGGSRRWWMSAGPVNGDGDDACWLSVVQPRCSNNSNNSNNSGHEPGKVVANDTTTTTKDDCRPAAPRWTAGVPTGHPVPTQARE